MIAAIEFKNFKILRSVRVELHPFNLLIGPNGSGKTSLIQAILRLRDLAALPASHEGGRQTRAGAAEITFHFVPPFEGLVVRLGCASEAFCDVLQVEGAEGESGRKLWEALRRRIARIESFSLHFRGLAAPCEPSEEAVLRPDGANLPSVLEALRQRHPERFRGLVAEFCRIWPEFSGIVIEDAPGGLRTFQALCAERGGSVPAGDLSQGVLVSLAFFVLAFLPDPPSVVCLEEADRGMHPRLLREVRDALYRLSYPQDYAEERPAVQVITTTHSPYLLDLFREHPDEILISQKKGQDAHFERLSERPDMAELLREAGLGDIWYSGILGGVPEAE